MPSITIELPQETTEKLREKAAQLGQSLESYLQALAQQNAVEPAVIASKSLSVEELDHFLDEFSAGLNDLPPLPEDFSREDIYHDHD